MERRAKLRIKPNRPLWLFLGSIAKWRERTGFTGRVHDFSVSGAFVETARPLLPGQKLPLKLVNGTDAPSEIHAVVRRIEPLRGVGIQFLNLDGATLRLLCSYWGDGDGTG